MAARPYRSSKRLSAPGLTPVQARDLALRLLQARGLHRIADNDRGDSFYLARSGMTATIRVSSHARTPKQRRTHPEVVTSIVIREPRSAAQVEHMVEVAAGIYQAALGGDVSASAGR